VKLSQAGIAPEAWTALDEGDRPKALDTLLETISADGDGATNGDATESLDPDQRRDLLRRAIIGVLSDLDPADPTARDYRRKLSAAL
jgi:thioredoxin-like negative regulator of GroEL